MPAGQSSIHLDPDTINAILAQFVNRTDGAQVMLRVELRGVPVHGAVVHLGGGLCPGSAPGGQ